jgi:hypothetical protein
LFDPARIAAEECSGSVALHAELRLFVWPPAADAVVTHQLCLDAARAGKASTLRFRVYDVLSSRRQVSATEQVVAVRIPKFTSLLFVFLSLI